jgi:hypothetical protein
MAVEFNWNLWGGKTAALEHPDDLRVVRVASTVLEVQGTGRHPVWGKGKPGNYAWLLVSGPSEELDALDEGTVIDLVRVRYGTP